MGSMSLVAKSNEEINKQFTRLASQSTNNMLHQFFNLYRKMGYGMHDSIVVFGSDNGAKNVFGDNSPLRGEKRLVLNGDVRESTYLLQVNV